LDNEYGHPHSATLDRLKAAGVKNLYRTDLCGNVVIRYQSQPPYFQIECDRQPDETVWNAGSGKEGADKELSDYWQSDGEKEDYYIGNTKSRKFHRPSCSQLPGEKNRVLFATREDAMKEKYAPCGACNP
jgi:competence protein ComEC